jgi:hypothetical protein
MAGSELWTEAVSEGKIAPHEYCVVADAERNLGLVTKDELLRFCMNAQRSYYYRIGFFWHLFSTALKNNDPSFLQSFLSVFFHKPTTKSVRG